MFYQNGAVWYICLLYTSIIDEALVKDVFLQKIIKAAAPSDIRIDIYNIENGVCELKKEAEDKERIIILVKTPQVVEALIDEGILLDKVILGGMGAKSGRRKFNRNVSASEEEIEMCIRDRYGRGVVELYRNGNQTAGRGFQRLAV